MHPSCRHSLDAIDWLKTYSAYFLAYFLPDHDDAFSLSQSLLRLRLRSSLAWTAYSPAFGSSISIFTLLSHKLLWIALPKASTGSGGWVAARIWPEGDPSEPSSETFVALGYTAKSNDQR